MTIDTIDWPARHMRAKAHLELLKAEWARAREKKVAPRYIPYDYREEQERLYQLTEGRATYGVVVRGGVVIDCAPYGYKRWMGKTEDALISASAVLAAPPPAPAGEQGEQK